MAAREQMTAGQITLRNSVPALAHWTVVTAFRPLHALMAAPAILFLATLTVMLFRPPDLQFYWLDRIRLSASRVCCASTGAGPAPAATIAHPCDVAHDRVVVAWGLPAFWPSRMTRRVGVCLPPNGWCRSRFITWRDLCSTTPASLRRFETFTLIALGYLCLIAILFLLGAKEFIFPRYILDESLGIHADRARGPFLQAVANGVTLEPAGTDRPGLISARTIERLARHCCWRLPCRWQSSRPRPGESGCRLPDVSHLAFLLSEQTGSARLPPASFWREELGLLTALSFDDTNTSFFARLEERSPVEFRVVMYQTGVEMFLEKPLAGWGPGDLQPELAKRRPRLSSVRLLLSQHLSGNCRATRTARTEFVSMDCD